MNTFVTPVGRVMGGFLDTPRTVDLAGKPKEHPTYEIWLGIRKDDPGLQPLLQQLGSIAQADFPRGESNQPGFSWKIKDGDAGNAKGEPYPQHCHGHMMLSFSSGFRPKYVDQQCREIVDVAGTLKIGDYVQIYGNASGNGQTQKPGIYLNMTYVRLAGYGEAIQTGPDPSAVFGDTPPALPPGASATPPAAAAPGGGMPGQQAPQAPGGSVPGQQPPQAPQAGAPGQQPPQAPQAGAPGQQAPQAGMPGQQAPQAPGGGMPGQQAPQAPGGGVPGQQSSQAPQAGMPGQQAPQAGMPGKQAPQTPQAGAPGQPAYPAHQQDPSFLPGGQQ